MFSVQHHYFFFFCCLSYTVCWYVWLKGDMEDTKSGVLHPSEMRRWFFVGNASS